VEKANAKKIELAPHYDLQFPLTTQNIVVVFRIDREVSERRGSAQRKMVSIYLSFKDN